MPIKKDDIAITGTQGGITCYISQGKNIFRTASPLTGARVKKDPAFAGFRKSSNRMREAAPIAASLYHQIPKEKKEFSLYRRLTGEAIKMIRDGIDQEIITQKLYDAYIIPLAEPAAMDEECLDMSSGLKLHSSLPQRETSSKRPLFFIQSFKDKISSSSTALIYLGRLKGYRKLKIWIKPGGS